MFERILVPLDGSSLAECVLPHVVALADAFSSHIILLHVLEQRAEEHAGPVDPLQWQIAKAEVEAYLGGISQRMREVGLDPEVVLLEGPSAERSIEYAQSQNIHLIALSTHGHTGLSRWNISGVVQKIVQNAKLSIMLVRAYTPVEAELGQLGYRRILVPLDGSQRAECVLPAAVLLASKQEATLIMAHIVHRPEMPQRTPLSDQDRELVERLVARRQELASKYLEELPARLGTEIESRLVLSEDVSEALHELVEQEKVDLVMLCAHGHSGKARWPYGGTALSLITYGSTPLLIAQDIPKEELQPSHAELAATERKGH